MKEPWRNWDRIKAYESRYEELQLRVISADSSLGANVFSYFARARVVMIDEEPVAELQKIVVEPVYSAKLYLDSIYLPEEDEWYHDRLDETIAEAGFGICVQVEDGILSRHYERDGLPYDFYPCQMEMEGEEEKKNGCVYVFGWLEGKNELSDGGPRNRNLGGGVFLWGFLPRQNRGRNPLFTNSFSIIETAVHDCGLYLYIQGE